MVRRTFDDMTKPGVVVLSHPQALLSTGRLGLCKAAFADLCDRSDSGRVQTRSEAVSRQHPVQPTKVLLFGQAEGHENVLVCAAAVAIPTVGEVNEVPLISRQGRDGHLS